MTKLLRRRVEPLEAPPGSFNRVLGEARRVRRHRGLVGASTMSVLALVAAGSFALGASIGVKHEIAPANDNKPPTQTSAPSHGKSESGGKDKVHSKSSTTKKSSSPTSWMSGRAVDSHGHGIPNLYVLPGVAGAHGFRASGRVAGTTNASGYYRVPCPHAPTLLSTWRLNSNYGLASAGGRWGAAFVGNDGKTVVPRCDGTAYTTRLVPGATVTGQLYASAGTGMCRPGDRYDLWLWLGGNHDNTIRLRGLAANAIFKLSGLPPGTHTLGVRHETRSVTVTSGATVEAGVYYSCIGSTPVPTETTEQSLPPETPSPTPQPAVTDETVSR